MNAYYMYVLTLDEPTQQRCEQWVAVFPLPGEIIFFNKAVTESDLDPKVRKCT